MARIYPFFLSLLQVLSPSDHAPHFAPVSPGILSETPLCSMADLLRGFFFYSPHRINTHAGNMEVSLPVPGTVPGILSVDPPSPENPHEI